MSHFDESIGALGQQTLKLLEQLDDHLARYPSARLAHYRPSALLAAIQREAGAEPLEPTPRYDPFVLEMAEKLGIAPADFLELQARRRAEMSQ